MMQNWYYEHDRANSQLHVYNTNKNEIASSPKTLNTETDELNIPEDVLSVLGDEIKAEINDNQAAGGAEITTHVMRIMAVMMLPDRNIQPL